MSEVTVRLADLTLPSDLSAVVMLIDAYAQDPMGNGKALPDEVKQRLGQGLRDHPTALVFLAAADERLVGVAVCFMGYSTFAAMPLINIHDLAVLPEYRGQRIGSRLLQSVESFARERACCKVTLEVQDQNHRALSLYRSFGFFQAEYTPQSGRSLFMVKPLADEAQPTD